MNPDALLTNLNQSQYAAVSSFADTLAILAGPGSGKTHTLTSRTAWLLARGLQPWNVIVATFTVKAAREMKERIGKLLGNGLESKLILGTFHSISRRYLARYGHLIDIRKDFGIADTTDSLAIIKRVIKRHNFTIDPKVARGRISGKKSRTSSDQISASQKPNTKSVEAQEFEMCYEQYEEALKRSNLLDYDDLLLKCVELLRKHPSCVSNVEAVLIDEFQDTNVVQFDLMRLFASERKRITIVGDPDQSIYGFRAAEVKNYKRMLHQYPDTVTIALEENYRSSGAILLTAMNVIKQDSSRVDKSLQATHNVGTRPVLRKLYNAHKEAEWIITEIQRCRGLTGELLDLNDFAILLRSSSLSRLIESALGKAGIAYRMVGGLRFYDRLEVKIILDYLRVINQPDNNDALSRIINTPSRRIGEATIKALLEEADQSKITLWALILGNVQGRRIARSKLSKQAESGLRAFVDIVLTARNKVADPDKSLRTVGLIKFVLKKIDFENWLQENHNDVAKGRWGNVEELITQASDFEGLVETGYEDESLPMVEGLHQDESSDSLSRFLANVALASEVKNEHEEGSATAQITISTIHAAKGLEWPIVFIPSTYQGSIPHSRAEDENEERRLLYVAMTRAKALLYMSYPLKNSHGEHATLSSFLSPLPIARLLDEKGPRLQSSTVGSIAQILRRPLPSSKSISESSRLLKSEEDNLFSLNGEYESHDAGESWNTRTPDTPYSMGGQPARRQNTELARSVGNTAGYRPVAVARYLTTMDRLASITVTPSEFVTARSLPAVEGQSADNRQSSTKIKELITRKQPLAEGESTLLNFLGKGEPQGLKRPRPTQDAKFLPDLKRVSKNYHAPHIGISPELSTHRVNMGPAFRRPQNRDTDSKEKPYVFLSSSPPQPQKAEKERVREPVIVAVKSAILPVSRPAQTMHATTMSMHTTTSMLQGGPAKRTLGVKRSMNSGWQSRKGQVFVPPSVRRPA
ncbi:P-loop containing nucleoside triphosphate hydrolase protein [Bisporella sp. PMI_857]|nr:P-loop containing nucleoside triphosphate hydrolase protein [Bisporella sp. PMI_857]